MQINEHTFSCELEDILQELRQQLTINGIELLQKEPRQSGNSLQIQCPYHGNGQERKPSAGIRKSDGMFHCFTCNEIHTLPEVVSYCFGHTDDYLGTWGWKWLVKNFITIQVEERPDIVLDYSRSRSHSVNTIDKFVSAEELDSYRYTHSYWSKRGITDENIIELFDLGYDRKTKCITFPVRDIEGRCEFVAKRSVKTKFFTYPEGVSKPLYGLYELFHSNIISGSRNGIQLFICESMIDCILLWQSGYVAVALNGLGNERQFTQLQSLPIRKMILCTDNDSAGRKARNRIKKHVKNKIFTEIEFPSDIKDVGECDKNQLLHILDWEVI